MVFLHSEELAEKALRRRYKNLRSLRKVPIISIIEYRTIKKEIYEIKKYLIEKRKQRLFGVNKSKLSG